MQKPEVYMNSKAKTLLILLLLTILMAGAYFAYNKLSAENQPDIAFPETGNEDKPKNVARVSPEDKISDAAENNENVGEADNPGQDAQSPAENKKPQESDEAGENEAEKLKAFDFTVYNVEGQQVKLSDFFGKPIIINFWATWCPYCVTEMPLFEESFRKYKDDIHFLMVQSIDGERETREKGEKFINDNGYTFPVYFDLDYDASYTYQAYALPTTVFIDKDGYLKAYHPGMLTGELLQKGIDLILE